DVGGRREDEVEPAALDQAEHGEVGIPVVDLVVAAARHDVGRRQRQQGAARVGGAGLPLEFAPETIDVLRGSVPWIGLVAAAGGLRQREALVDEAGEIEAWAGALLRVLRGDGGRRGGGDGV